MEYRDIVDLLENKDIQPLEEEQLHEASWSKDANRLRELEVELSDVNHAVNQLYDLLKVRMKIHEAIRAVKNINDKFTSIENEQDLGVVIDVLAEIENDARRFNVLTKFGIDDFRQLVKILPTYQNTLGNTFDIIQKLARNIPGMRRMQKGKKFFADTTTVIKNLFK